MIDTKKKIIKSFLKKFWITILIYILTNIMREYVSIYIVQVVGNSTDLILKRSFEALKGNIPVLIFALIIAIFVVPMMDYVWKNSLVGLGVKFDSEVFNIFLRQKRGLLNRYENGELIYRVEYDPNRFRMKLLDIIGDTFVFSFVIIQSFYIMLSYHVGFAILCLLLSMLPAIIPILTKKLIKNLFSNEEKLKGEMLNNEKDMVENFAFIKVHLIENKVLELLKNSFKKYYTLVLRKKIIFENAVSFINILFSIVCQISIYIIGGYLVANNTLSVGNVIKFFGLSFIVKDDMRYIIRVIKNCLEFNVASDRLMELIDNNEQSGLEIIDDINNINITNLTFSYSNKTALSNINIVVNRGEHIMLLGENGSGKTTLIKILTGMYDEYTGNIFINNVPLKEINLEALREVITVAPQMPFLFNDTIYNNIEISKKNASTLEIDNVLRMFDIYDIKDKVVGEDGSFISGGQKQRISLARAALRNTPLLIFDEPDTALDIDTTIMLKEYISSCKNTIIVISHNKDLTDIFDRTYTL